MLNIALIGQATGTAQSTEAAGATKSQKQSKDSNFADFVNAQKEQDNADKVSAGTTEPDQVSEGGQNEEVVTRRENGLAAEQASDTASPSSSESSASREGVRPGDQAADIEGIDYKDENALGEVKANSGQDRQEAGGVHDQIEDQTVSVPKDVRGAFIPTGEDGAVATAVAANQASDSSAGETSRVDDFSQGNSGKAGQATSNEAGTVSASKLNGSQEEKQAQTANPLAQRGAEEANLLPKSEKPTVENKSNTTVQPALQTEVGKDGVLKQFSTEGKVVPESTVTRVTLAQAGNTTEQQRLMEVGKSGVLAKFEGKVTGAGDSLSSDLVGKTKNELLQTEVGKSGVLTKFEGKAAGAGDSLSSDLVGKTKNELLQTEVGKSGVLAKFEAKAEDVGIARTSGASTRFANADASVQNNVVKGDTPAIAEADADPGGAAAIKPLEAGQPKGNALPTPAEPGVRPASNMNPTGGESGAFKGQAEAAVVRSGQEIRDTSADSRTTPTLHVSQQTTHAAAPLQSTGLPENKIERKNAADPRYALESETVAWFSEATDPRLRGRSSFLAPTMAPFGMPAQVGVQIMPSQTAFVSAGDRAALGVERLVEGGHFASELPGLTQLLTEAVLQPGSVHRPETPRHIASQLAEAIVAKGERNVEVALNPEELGRVKMRVSTSEAGITVIIQTERPETGDLMRRHISELAAEFKRMGFENISFEFSGGDSAGGNTGQASTNGNGTGLGENGEDLIAAPLSEQQVQHLNLGNSGVDMRI